MSCYSEPTRNDKGSCYHTGAVPRKVTKEDNALLMLRDRWSCSIRTRKEDMRGHVNTCKENVM